MDPKVGIQKTNIGGDKHTFKDNEDTISLKYQSKRKSDQQWTFLVAFLSVKCWFLQRPVCFFKFIHVLFILNMAKLEVRLIMIGIQRIYTFHRTHLKQVKKLSPKLNKLSCLVICLLNCMLFFKYTFYSYIYLFTRLCSYILSISWNYYGDDRRIAPFTSQSVLDSVLVPFVFGAILIKWSCSLWHGYVKSARRYDSTHRWCWK